MGALSGGTGDQVLATFGPSTAWCGKAMTFSDGAFVLEGYGLVRAADVLTYDRQDHLIWAYDGLGEWVTQCAAAERVASRPASLPHGGGRSFSSKTSAPAHMPPADVTVTAAARRPRREQGCS